MIGCAHTNPTTHIKTLEPKSYSIPEHNNLVFQQSKKVTWNRVLKKFSDSKIFTVNEIDNSAQHLIATFDVQPEQYFDCGSRVILNKDHPTTVVNVQSHYKYSRYRRNHLDTYYIKNNLTGVVNIFVNGNTDTSTAIIQIVFKLDVNEMRRTTQGTSNINLDYSLNLTPNEVKYFDAFDTYCRSKGKLETEITTLLEG